MSGWRGRLVRWVPVAVLTAGLIAAADPGVRRQRPLDAEATYVMMSESLLADGDLTYRPEDLRRAFERWPEGPAGLRLAARPARLGASSEEVAAPELVYAAPPLYSLVTLPWFAAFGRLGLLWANAFAWALAGHLFYCRLAPPDRAGRLWCAAFGLASATIGYLLLPQPQALLGAAVFAAAVLWLDGRRLRSAAPPSGGLRRAAEQVVTGGLLGAAGAVQPALLLVLAAVGLDLAAARRRAALRNLAAGAVLVWLAAAAATGWTTGGGVGASARTFIDDFPYQRLVAAPAAAAGSGTPAAGALSDLAPFYRPESAPPRGGRRYAVEAWYFLVGRFGGLVVLFPLGLVALLVAAVRLGEAKERGSLLFLLTAVLAVAAIAIWQRSLAGPGEAGLLGARGFAAVYPLLLLLAPWPPRGWAVTVLSAAVAVWTLPALVSFAVSGEPPSAGPGPRRALALLPAELTRFHDAERFGFVVAEGPDAVWLLPSSAARLGSEHDLVWLRDGRRSEVWAVSPRKLDSIRLTARAHGRDRSLSIASSAASVRVRFDTGGKSAGTPLDLRPAVRMTDLGVFGRREHFHRWRVETSRGWTGPGEAGLELERRFGVLLDLSPSFESGPAAMHRDRLAGGDPVAEPSG